MEPGSKGHFSIRSGPIPVLKMGTKAIQMLCALPLVPHFFHHSLFTSLPGGVSQMMTIAVETKKKSRFNILSNPKDCVGCRLCQMRCSFRFTKMYSLSHSLIEITWNEKQLRYHITFNDLCDSCGLCVQACVYDALSLEKESLNRSAL